MCHTVLFSLAARQKLEQRLATQPDELDRMTDDIVNRLSEVFAEGHAAIVQDIYSGYRVHPEEFVLLVELSGSGDHDGRYVVKLGPRANLVAELQAWRNCRPTGLRHDLVLMPIDPRPNADEPVGLVYADAQQFIGVDQTLPLESALLDAARVGFPTPESVGELLFQLYERLGVVMYRYSAGSPPPRPRAGMNPAELQFDSHFERNLACWDPPTRAPDEEPEAAERDRERLAFDTRSSAQHYADDPNGERYRDPVDAFRAIVDYVRGGGNPAHYVPIVLRGRSHGDLHGRNVLVGRVRDRVLWPAVYDHEHMGRTNIVGWDFVKLETEFKVRAYPELFPGTPEESVPRIVRFEHALFDQTERCRDSGVWPTAPATRDHEGRLAWLVLKIRDAAGRHLGLLRGRCREWLAEYYFLLWLYGINAIRFTNLEAPELRAAYLSAGTACARYLYDRERPTDPSA